MLSFYVQSSRLGTKEHPKGAQVHYLRGRQNNSQRILDNKPIWLGRVATLPYSRTCNSSIHRYHRIFSVCSVHQTPNFLYF